MLFRSVQQNGANPDELVSQLDIALSSMERQVLQRMDHLQARPALFEAIKHLLVGGNALLYVGTDSIRMYGLRSFCVDRDPDGSVTEIVIRELVSHRHLPPGAEAQGEEEDDDTEELYTHVTIDPSAKGNQVEWFQEYDGKKIQIGRAHV